VCLFLLQGAQLTVLAFPHELRVFGVADCVALDAGQPSAAELLAQGAAEVRAMLCAMTNEQHHEDRTSCGHCIACAGQACDAACTDSSICRPCHHLVSAACWNARTLDMQGPSESTFRAANSLPVLQPDLPLLALEDALLPVADMPTAPAADCNMAAA
jgi:hypothetical protein